MAYSGGEFCLKCLERDIKNNVPVLKRTIQPLPCPEHGHPAVLPRHLATWVDFFSLVSPYSTSQTLDHALISKICDDYDIRFTEAFYWLRIIHREVVKRNEKHKGTGQSLEGYEGKI